jgi:acetolactate synthase-1/2/3 large subunit
MNGAETAVEALRREGVDHVFGLPGTTIMHLIDALGRHPDIRYISVRHEQVASFMADGYARATGRVGVCVASRGPGAANLSIGVHNAHAESVPLLALVGQVSDDIAHREAFEEIDLVRFFEPLTKWQVEVHETGRIPELLQRALRTAVSGRPGSVFVSLPLDVQTRSAEPVFGPGFRPSPPSPDPGDVGKALERLVHARRPVIVVGGGMLGGDHDPHLIELADRLQVPVVTTWLRKDAFPNGSPLFAGSLGYGAVAATDELVRDADVLLALGCRFSEFTTKRWSLLSAETELIQVDVDPGVLGQYYIPAVGICADARATTRALVAALGRLPGGPADGHDAPVERRRRRVAEVRRRYLEQTGLPSVPSGSGRVSSAALIEALRHVLGRTRATLVQDAPGFGTWIHRYLDFPSAGSFYAAAGGSMGWGFPAAMGIQLARPDDRIITVCGDGSFWMVAQDLETAVREELPVVNIITNNFAFGNTRDRQRTAHGGRYTGVFYGNPDFAGFARLLGAHGERVEKDGDLVPAIERALASGRPAVIDVIQDVNEGLPPDLVPPSAR